MNDIEKFERLIADFYGAPFAVAVDCFFKVLSKHV